MDNQVLQELCRYSINITKCEEALLSWHESCLSVLAEKGLHMFEFSHNLQCFEKKIDCIQSFIKHPTCSPTVSLFSPHVVKELRNIEQNELIVDHALWPHNPQLLLEMSTIIDFKWSPLGTVASQDSAIAIMSNVGVVEIYKQNMFAWICVLEISTQFCIDSGIHAENPRNFSMFKASAHALATTAICWCPKLNNDKSCYFITVQKSGSIILWLLDLVGKQVSAKILGSLNSGTSEIMSVTWIPMDQDGQFSLIFSNVIGQIFAYKCEIQNNALNLLDSNVIWKNKDRMITNQLQYIVLQNKTILIFNKHRHLVVLVLRKDCTILGQYIRNINDYRITSITKYDDVIHISTVNCKIYELNLTFLNTDLEMNLSLIECQGLTPTHELYSMSHSYNNVIFALSTLDRKVYVKKGNLTIDILFMSTKEKLDSLLDTLMSNPTKQLTHYWDVIEVLRYKTMKTRAAPSVDYNQLYETACSDLYMLKVYLIVCTLCDSLKRLCKIGPSFSLPEESINIVKEEILVAHADKVVKDYSKKFQEQNKLEAYEIEFFIGAKKFLEYFFRKSNRNLSEVMNLNMLNFIDCNVTYICQFCDEEVNGFTCGNEHLNMFCALTFTPIHDSNYLICKWCNLTAREELLTVNPMCLFCGVNLHLINQ